ncbi:MAG: YitT family protein [Erysipelotrichaceae bacterium]|nr:YitT family protein [Erysipelotrichaceae bacterium]
MFKKNTLIKYLSIFTGMVILSFGLFNIHSRSVISEGGILGASLLFKQWFNISPSFTSLTLDSICFILGIIVLGKDFLKDSAFASISFSLCYRFFEKVTGPLLPVFNNLFITAIIGAIFVGVGVGLVVRNGCAAGGDDALALVLNKKFNTKVSTTYIVSDTIVLLLSLSYIPFKDIFFSLFSVWLSGFIIEIFHDRKITSKLKKKS